MPLSSNPAALEFFVDPAGVDADWKLLEETGTCTAFQTRAWLHPFYREVAPSLGLEPLFLRLSDPTTGRPLMLLPLVRRRQLGLRIVSFADAGVCDFNAPLIANGLTPECEKWLWQQALQALRTQGAVLNLEKLPSGGSGEASPLLSLVPDAEPMSFGTWAVDLPPSLEDFQNDCLAPAFLKDLAMRRRRLEKKGNVRFALATTAGDRATAFETLAHQRARRFAETGRTDVLAQPAFRGFYRAAAVANPGDTVRLFTLSVDDTTVSVILALDHTGTRYMVMPTFEAGEWKNCSPGNLLMMMCMGEAIASGLRRFDFTIGDEGYKAGFGAARRAVWRGLVPLSIPGALAVRAVRLARVMRERLRPDRKPGSSTASGSKAMKSQP